MRTHESTELGIDHVTKVRRLEHYLSADSPVFASVDSYPEPTELSFDQHEGIEVGVLLSGYQERHWEGFTCDIGPGETWLAAMWEPHGQRGKVPNTGFVVVIFLPEFLEGIELADLPWLSMFSAPASQRPQVTSNRQRERLLSIAQAMGEELQEQRPRWMTGLRIGVVSLLFELFRDWSPPIMPSRSGTSAGNRFSRIMPALDLVRDRGPQTVGVAEAARACNVSRTTLNRIFRETMGISFGRFRLRAHLAHATQRLLTTDLPVEHIATETGFTDASHLHRAFLKHYGKTPGQYRAEGRRLSSVGLAGRTRRWTER